MFEVTFLPILVAALVGVGIAFVWYHAKVFGPAFRRVLNLTSEQTDRGIKRMPLSIFIAFLGNIVAAYVLNYFGIAWGVYDWIGGVELGIWVWIGFVAPVLLSSVLWEMKPFKYYAINAGYWLVSFVAMAVVLVLLG